MTTCKERVSQSALEKGTGGTGFNHPETPVQAKQHESQSLFPKKNPPFLAHQAFVSFRNSVTSFDATECAVKFASYKKFMAYGAKTLNL